MTKPSNLSRHGILVSAAPGRIGARTAGIVALLTGVIGCVDASEDAQLESSAEQGPWEPTSVIDPDTGEPVAINFEPPDTEPVYVPSDTVDNVLSADFEDVWAGTGQEASINLPRNSVIVGVGARVNTDDNVTTLDVLAREHMSNGSLGPETYYMAGVEPNHSLEVWCEAPDGEVVVGLGGRINDHNLTTLRIWTMRYNPDTGVLEGQFHETRCGSEPNVYAEQEVAAWDVPPPINLSRWVMNGVAMRCRHSNLAGLRGRFRELQL